MIRLAFNAIAALLVITLAASCVDSGSAPASPAAMGTTSQAPDEEQEMQAVSIADPGGAWKLVELPEGTPVPDDIEITITFDGTQASGSSGCNTYSGTIEKPSPGELEPGLMSATQKFCEGDVMQLETAYLRALGSASSYTLENDTLTIGFERGDDKAATMVFVRTE